MNWPGKKEFQRCEQTQKWSPIVRIEQAVRYQSMSFNGLVILLLGDIVLRAVEVYN